MWRIIEKLCFWLSFHGTKFNHADYIIICSILEIEIWQITLDGHHELRASIRWQDKHRSPGTVSRGKGDHPRFLPYGQIRNQRERKRYDWQGTSHLTDDVKCSVFTRCLSLYVLDIKTEKHWYKICTSLTTHAYMIKSHIINLSVLYTFKPTANSSAVCWKLTHCPTLV